MADRSEMPGEFTCGGHTWEYHTYDNGNRHQWYRPFTDEEVSEKSKWFDDLDDVREDDDYFVACPAFEDPSFLIELHHMPSLETYEVTASETRLTDGITDPISTKDFKVETDDREEAIAAVEDFAERLS